MSISRVIAVLVAVLSVGGGFVAVNPAPATSSTPRTVYVDAMYDRHVMPKRIFMYANSGPWAKNLHWDGWGTDEAVAHGAWISDCASCLGPDRRQVTIRLVHKVYCPKLGVSTYKRMRGILSVPDEGYTDRRFSRFLGCPPR